MPVENRSFFYPSAALSFSFTEVVELAEVLESLNLIQQGNANIETRPGLPFGNIVGFEYLKNEEGRKVLPLSIYLNPTPKPADGDVWRARANHITQVDHAEFDWQWTGFYARET